MQCTGDMSLINRNECAVSAMKQEIVTEDEEEDFTLRAWVEVAKLCQKHLRLTTLHLHDTRRGKERCGSLQYLAVWAPRGDCTDSLDRFCIGSDCHKAFNKGNKKVTKKSMMQFLLQSVGTKPDNAEIDLKVLARPPECNESIGGANGSSRTRMF